MSAPNSMVDVEMFPAAEGDAFLIRCHGRSGAVNILVDGGPSSTYTAHLRPRLRVLAAAGQDLHLLVVSHVDADHISGVIAFLTENGPADRPSVIRVRDVWHNSYRHLPLAGREPTREERMRVLQQIVDPALRGPVETPEISARQGSVLAALLRRHAYPWNAAFGGRDSPVTAPTVVNVEGVRMTILSPRTEELARLAYAWQKQLLIFGVAHDAVLSPDFEDAFEAELLREIDNDPADNQTGLLSASTTLNPPSDDAFREDSSVTNRSSIAFHLAFDTFEGLFLGDAAPSVVLDTLAMTKELPLTVNVMKVAHHGSKRNTSPQLLRSVSSPHFLVSTDGSKHGHPHLEALLSLVATKPQTTLHFNYAAAAQTIIESGLISRFQHNIVARAATEAALRWQWRAT